MSQGCALFILRSKGQRSRSNLDFVAAEGICPFRTALVLWVNALLCLACIFYTCISLFTVKAFKFAYSVFLKHCTLTNKAVGTIWRDLSKPPQRRQGPDPRPLWLLVGTPLVLGPELASRRAEHSLLLWMSSYIFDILFLSPYMFV